MVRLARRVRKDTALVPPKWDESKNGFAACLNVYLCGPSRETYARTTRRCCQNAYRQDLAAHCAAGLAAP